MLQGFIYFFIIIPFLPLELPGTFPPKLFTLAGVAGANVLALFSLSRIVMMLPACQPQSFGAVTDIDYL